MAILSDPAAELALPADPASRHVRLEPEGGFEPSTYRLQIGCAAVAPLGRLFNQAFSGVTKLDPRKSGAI